MRILDRYVLRSWLAIFVLTALGFPLVSVMINMTDNLERLMDRGLKFQEILLSYFYALPENVFLVMPHPLPEELDSTAQASPAASPLGGAGAPTETSPASDPQQ